jgi:hypothetical protein
LNQPNVALLKKRLKNAGIKHIHVAAAAHVGESCVSHVLAGRLKSANVIEAARRLLREASNGAAA